MRIKATFTLLLMLTPVFTTAHAEDLMPVFEAAAVQLTSSMSQCSERIWPGYDLKKQGVLMVQPGAAGLLWLGDGTREVIASADVPAPAFGGMFGAIEFRGRELMAVNPTGDADFSSASGLVRLATHEIFHVWGQTNWKPMQGLRGTLYPVMDEPRMIRHMLFERMREYFLSGGKNTGSLKKAAFWYKRWTDEFTGETTTTTDALEGTARYVEFMSAAIGSLGCAADDSTVQNAIREMVIGKMGGRVDSEQFSLDDEGYEIGGLAALILRFINKDMKWQKTMAGGATPLTALLKKVKPKSDKAPAELIAKFKAAGEKQNAELGQILDPDLKALDSGDFVRLQIPETAMPATFSPTGFYLPTDWPDVIAMPLAVGLVMTDEWSLKADSGKVMLQILDSPCGGGWTVVVAKKDAKIEDGRIQVASPGLSGEMNGHAKTAPDGAEWFCGTGSQKHVH